MDLCILAKVEGDIQSHDFCVKWKPKWSGRSWNSGGKRMTDEVVEVARINPRIMKVKIVMGERARLRVHQKIVG